MAGRAYSIVRKIVFGGHREAALAAVAIQKPHHGRSPGLLRFVRNDDDPGFVHDAITRTGPEFPKAIERASFDILLTDGDSAKIGNIPFRCDQSCQAESAVRIGFRAQQPNNSAMPGLRLIGEDFEESIANSGVASTGKCLASRRARSMTGAGTSFANMMASAS